MTTNEKVLRAFITEKLEDMGYTADEVVLKTVVAGVSLREGRSNEKEEVRSLKLKEATDGTITARHFSLYNLLQVSNFDYRKLLIDELAILAIPVEQKVKALLAILALINNFFEKLSYDFNAVDAKILLAIYHLENRNQFSPEAVQQSYLDEFGEDLVGKQLERSLNFFVNRRVLRKLKDNQYRLREQVSYERD